MNARTVFSGSAAARSVLTCIVILEFMIVENVVFGLLVAGEDVHSVLAFALQFPHAFTLVTNVVVVLYYRHGRNLLNVLFGLYMLAFVADIGGIIAHSILAYKADGRERRNEVVYVVVLFFLCSIDALGLHFADRLRDCFVHEARYLASLMAPNRASER